MEVQGRATDKGVVDACEGVVNGVHERGRQHFGSEVKEELGHVGHVGVSGDRGRSRGMACNTSSGGLLMRSSSEWRQRVSPVCVGASGGMAALRGGEAPLLHLAVALRPSVSRVDVDEAQAGNGARPPRGQHGGAGAWPGGGAMPSSSTATTRCRWWRRP